MNPREQLHYLIKEYVNGKYNTITFCNEFTRIYDVEIDYEDLSKLEISLFSELSSITARFSPYEEDFEIPNVYYNEHEVRDEVKRIEQKLQI